MAAHGLNAVAEGGVCALVRHPMYAASREPITVDTVALTLPEGWTTAQRDSALTVLARYRAQWVAARPQRSGTMSTRAAPAACPGLARES